MKNILAIFALAIVLFSCEDVVKINVNEGVNQLVVDAWLTDQIAEQKIVLTVSQPYFDNSSPTPALGATVIVYNQDSTAHVFTDKNNKGVYTYTPKNGSFLKENEITALYIKYGNEEYYSTSTLKRVPKIDSVSYENYSLPIAPSNGSKDGFLAQFYAKDFAGEGDTYLVRYSKNDTLHFKPSEINIAYDAGFSQNSATDGLLFILPIRQAINSTDNLWQNKDTLKVELYSIPLEAYFYLQQVRTESNNGGIFATPLSNIPTNIINLNKNSSQKALGAFFVSKLSTFTTIIDKSLAKPKKPL